MVTVPIHQDTSSVPLMTTLVIDLTVSQPVPTAVQAPLPTITATRMGELELHMADMVEANQALEEILEKQGSRLYKLENLNIPNQNMAYDKCRSYPAEQVPVMAPPTGTNGQILPRIRCNNKFHPRPCSPLHLPNEEPVLGYLKFSAKGTKREVFGMPIPNDLITNDIRGEQYYNAYLEKVSTQETKTCTSKPQKRTKVVTETSEAQSLAKRSKAGKVVKKRTKKSSLQLVDEFVEEGVQENKPRICDEEANLQKAVEESLKEFHSD
ncbi:retrovirus-related pol polyprotein from transposon TNT 1-94 [Tanacetum coccineum]|uniref:Retrovirus-related pol polyprotein from transposon TNT 1-94 n=1 Tax=Tanacetum coccineum TaxID=301880 RepID=A0ABQ5B885_9ASTR